MKFMACHLYKLKIHTQEYSTYLTRIDAFIMILVKYS